MYKKLKKISKSVFVRILLFSIVLNTRNFSSLDNIRARNPPFLETIARTNLPLLRDFIFLTTHRVWKIRYISRWRRSGNQLYLSRKTRTNLSLLKMLFLRRVWARKHLRNHSNIIFRHLRSINIFRNTLCKIRSTTNFNLTFVQNKRVNKYIWLKGKENSRMKIYDKRDLYYSKDRLTVKLQSRTNLAELNAEI